MKLTNKKYIIFLPISLTSILLATYFLINININLYNENRVYSLRKVSPEYRVSLLNAFINKNYKENSILILGDSQPNGHAYSEKFIFSKLLQKSLEKNILNLAFTDSRILDNIYILEYLMSNNMKFDYLIFNVNQSHIKQNDFQHLNIKNGQNYQYGILKEFNSFINLTLNPNPIGKPSENIFLTKYENYFEIKKEKQKEYFDRLEIFVNLAKNISNNVIIYITPHSQNAVKFNNENDIGILNKFTQDVFNFCENKDIKCIDIDITEDDYYIDIVHFNSKGHEKMNDILFNILK